MATIKGGEKLEQTLAAIAKKIGTKAVLRVGFLEGATYPGGTPVAMIAAIHNFGAPRAGIPARPFFSNMVREKSPGWGKALVKNLVANDFDVDRSLRMMGEGIAGQLRQSIKDTNEPPLAASTIKRKGFAKPLVDTGQMMNSVDYEVDVQT